MYQLTLATLWKERNQISMANSGYFPEGLIIHIDHKRDMEREYIHNSKTGNYVIQVTGLNNEHWLIFGIPVFWTLDIDSHKWVYFSKRT